MPIQKMKHPIRNVASDWLRNVFKYYKFGYYGFINYVVVFASLFGKHTLLYQRKMQYYSEC